MQNTVTRPPAVRIAFRTFWRTLRHAYDNLATFGLSSILWIVLAILIIPLGPATAGLHRVVQPMTEERASSIGRFWSHFRSDWGWSSLLIWTFLLGLFIWDTNRRFYNQLGNPLLLLLGGLFLVIILVWLGMLLFAIPLALRQTDLRLRTTLRNAAVIVIANLPGVIVSMILLLLSSLVLSVIPPLFFLVPGWIALWTEENLRLLLVESGQIPPDEFADRARRPRS